MNYFPPHLSQANSSYCDMTYQLRANSDQLQSEPVNTRETLQQPPLIDNCGPSNAIYQTKHHQHQIYDPYTQEIHQIANYNLYGQPQLNNSQATLYNSINDDRNNTITYDSRNFTNDQSRYSMEPIETNDTVSNQYLSISTRSIVQVDEQPQYHYNNSIAIPNGSCIETHQSGDIVNHQRMDSLNSQQLVHQTAANETNGDFTSINTIVNPNRIYYNTGHLNIQRSQPQARLIRNAQQIHSVNPNSLQIAINNLPQPTTLSINNYNNEQMCTGQQHIVNEMSVPNLSPDNCLLSNQLQQQSRSDRMHLAANSHQTNINGLNYNKGLVTTYLDHIPQTVNSHVQHTEQQQNPYNDGSSSNGSGSSNNTLCFTQDWLDGICRYLIDHMNHFGICVIDDFLGASKGESILKEVLELYSSGQHSKGRLVNNKLNTKSPRDEASSIRSDRVIWIDGCEHGCSEINNLIQTLCSVITNSSRLSLYSNNGLDRVIINKRTKAHVACYPGNGTRYIKHVDNPNGDGRVITAIYYLNKNWNTKRDGGLLRMFPAGMDKIANIEPLFDRVLFFWSDRRNPHEVLPAYKDRFAITVWYIGETRP